MNTTSVDAYLQDGCGRCELYKTPDCRVHLWTEPLSALREMLRATELVEEMKWGSPCYTLGGKNVVMLAAQRDYVALSFFKGVAIADEDGLLEAPGPNSRYARYFRYRSGDALDAYLDKAAPLVERAIDVERTGVVINVDHGPEPRPIELERRLAAEPALAAAFEALTPGRQRSHCLHIGGAKQATTRERRVDKCLPKILAGKGFNER